MEYLKSIGVLLLCCLLYIVCGAAMVWIPMLIIHKLGWIALGVVIFVLWVLYQAFVITYGDPKEIVVLAATGKEVK